MKRRILLDTQALLWIRSDDARLTKRARKEFEDEEAVLFLSIASVWELAIKLGLGKLELDIPLSDFVSSAVQTLGISLLPIELEHVLRAERLPLHHRDPFDRLLVCQALHERLGILSSDASLDAYGVKRVW